MSYLFADPIKVEEHIDAIIAQGKVCEGGLAFEAGLSPDALTKLRKGERVQSKTVLKFCSYTGCEMSDLKVRPYKGKRRNSKKQIPSSAEASNPSEDKSGLDQKKINTYCLISEHIPLLKDIEISATPGGLIINLLNEKKFTQAQLKELAKQGIKIDEGLDFLSSRKPLSASEQTIDMLFKERRKNENLLLPIEDFLFLCAVLNKYPSELSPKGSKQFLTFEDLEDSVE